MRNLCSLFVSHTFSITSCKLIWFLQWAHIFHLLASLVLQTSFTGNYNEYFGYATDIDAVVYLMLVNDVIHGLYPEAVSIGEDVSTFVSLFWSIFPWLKVELYVRVKLTHPLTQMVFSNHAIFKKY